MFKCPALPSSFLIVAFTLAACTSTKSLEKTPETPIPVEGTSSATNSIEQDRSAILAMAGNYKVTFNFVETAVLKEGYEIKKPKLSGANEIVRVIEDRPGFISLQHTLIMGVERPFPIKHWRQDWIYEPEYIFDFVGFNSWKKRTLTKDQRAGKWAQVVYQIDDSPRYAAVAEWTHENGMSAWTSPPTMRPLPRRDMTTRDDYHGLLATNRHAITPDGWVHEQDNTKMILTGAKPEALVKERGVNTYRRSGDFDAEIGETYWTSTEDYWAGVRSFWGELEKEKTAFGLTLQGEPVDLYTPVMAFAESVAKKELTNEEALKKARSTIDKYTTIDISTSIEKAKSSAEPSAK